MTPVLVVHSDAETIGAFESLQPVPGVDRHVGGFHRSVEDCELAANRAPQPLRNQARGLRVEAEPKCSLRSELAQPGGTRGLRKPRSWSADLLTGLAESDRERLVIWSELVL